MNKPGNYKKLRDIKMIFDKITFFVKIYRFLVFFLIIEGEVIFLTSGLFHKIFIKF